MALEASAIVTGNEIALETLAVVVVASAAGELLPSGLRSRAAVELRTLIVRTIAVRFRASLRMVFVGGLALLVGRRIVLGLVVMIRPIVGIRESGRRRCYPCEQQRNGKFTHDSDLSSS